MPAQFLAQAGKWALNNPQSVLAVAQVGNSLYRHINPDRRTELINDTLNSQTQFRDMLARQAFGNFTAAERQQIQAANEPQVNQVAANVSSRGLGTSGAGAQIITQAQQAPLQFAQQNAMQALPGANQNLLASSQYLAKNDTVGQLLSSLQGKLALLNDDQEVALTFTDLFNELMGVQPTTEETSETSGQGYQSNSPFLTGGILDQSGLNTGYNAWLFGG